MYFMLLRWRIRTCCRRMLCVLTSLALYFMYRSVKFSMFYVDNVPCFKQAIDGLIEDSIHYAVRMNSSALVQLSERPQEVEWRIIHEKFKNWESRNHPELCIGVMTTGRGKNSPRFLVPTVVSLLRKISKEDLPKVLIYIVNNDGSDELHEDAYLFAHSLPVVTAYESQLKILQSDAFQSSNSRLAQFYRMNNLDYEPAIKGASLAAPVEAGQHKYQKQAKDYLFALDACSLLSPHHEINYTLILEDDTYADDEYLPKIMSAVGRLKGKKWGLLKLWFTEHFMGWSTFDVPILIFFGFLGLTAAKYVAKFNAKVDSDKLANYVGVFSGLLFLLILVIIGKQNLLPRFREGLLETDVECCSPAHLYPTSIIGDLSRFVRANEDDLPLYPIDLMIDRFLFHARLKKFLLYPNPFQHIGIKSSFNVTDDPTGHPFLWSESFSGPLFDQCFPK